MHYFKNLASIICIYVVYISLCSFDIFENAKTESVISLTEKASFYKRSYSISQITEKPVIDGKLDDKTWSTGAWSEEYVQHLPAEGSRASERTILKVQYDEKNIYVAIRCFDSQPDKVQRYVGRRDEFTGDITGICFDSYHDQRTGYEFDITAGGSKIDVLLKSNGEADFNWNAVWFGEVAIEDSAWTAELQIPLSQLRYNDKEEQLWGMHSWRWIGRYQEEDQWSLIPRNNSGFIHSFGEIKGMKGLAKSRRIEIVPYTLAKVKNSPVEVGNPFSKRNNYNASFGVDGKLGVGSDFTLDYTINPDFGQVEADPSVMNLSAFETFYAEQRPFFLEGKNVLDYTLDNDQLFYSRRIGRSPSCNPESDTDNKKYVLTSPNTSILDAIKFSGKTSNGLSIGIMQSFTNQEFANIDSAGSRSSVVSEPFSNFMLGRVQKDYNGGNTVIGGILTSANRVLNNNNVANLHREAYSGGLDLTHYFFDRNYYINLKSIYSHVAGNEQAMLDLQQSSVHYFQRPDASYLEVDSSMRKMTGHGGLVSVGRSSANKLNFEEKVSWRSPGLELNDMGFLSMADFISQKAQINYNESEPGSFYREYHSHIELVNQWNFGGLNTKNTYMLSNSIQFTNNWHYSMWVFRQHSAIDTRELRGGPALRMSPFWHFGSSINTDWSKKVVFQIEASRSVSPSDFSSDYRVSPGLFFKINSKINLQSNFSYSVNDYNLMYVNTLDYANDKRYIMGKLNQETMNMTIRFNYNITPNISLQYYGSPFFTQGNYSEMKRITNPMAESFNNRFETIKNENISFLDAENKYRVTEGSGSYDFDNPDFNVKELNSNLVFRWEYKPGSALFLVWSHHRADDNAPYATEFGKSVKTLFNSAPDNIFMFKLNYYFAI